MLISLKVERCCWRYLYDPILEVEMVDVPETLLEVPVVPPDELLPGSVEPLSVDVPPEGDALPEELALLLVADDEGIVPRNFCESPSKSCRDPRFCSRSLNCANCVTKVVPSIGWVGS